MNLRIWPALIFILLFHATIPGQDSCGHFFYTHPQYGSQCTFNPASIFLNGGFDIMQTGMFDSRLFRVPYRKSANNVFDNVAHPMRQISAHGWRTFVCTELLPTDLRIDRSQYLPNYTLHLLGGGATFRMMREWNEVHHVPYPKISAVLLSTAYNALNEVIENGSYSGVNVDPIADIWIFNPLGMLLFSSDRVARFFSSSAQLCDWSTMPFVDPVHGKIDNVSQNWALKIPLPYIDSTRLFIYLGMSEVVGFSSSIKNGYALSWGAGFSVGDILEADPGSGIGRIMTIKYTWNTGVFVDKNQSLLFSLIVSNSRLYKVRANLYPLPDFHVGPMQPGFFAALGKNNDVVLGVTASVLPVSLAVRAQK
jgi:hypothetical protein